MALSWGEDGTGREAPRLPANVCPLEPPWGPHRPGPQGVRPSPSLSQIWSLGPTSTAPKGSGCILPRTVTPTCPLPAPTKERKPPANSSTKESYPYLPPCFPQNGQEASELLPERRRPGGRPGGRPGSHGYLDFQSEVLPAGKELVQRVLGVFHVAAVLAVDQEPGRADKHTHAHTCRDM